MERINLNLIILTSIILISVTFKCAAETNDTVSVSEVTTKAKLPDQEKAGVEDTEIYVKQKKPLKKKKDEEKYENKEESKLRKHKEKTRSDTKRTNDDQEDQSNTICGCRCLANKTCSDVKYLKTFGCQTGKNISLNSLCNGIDDCGDGSDEENCFQWALQKVQQAKDVIDNAKNTEFLSCFNFNSQIGDASSGEIFHKLLRDQTEVLDKLNSNNILQLSAAGRFKDKDANQKAANDAVLRVTFIAETVENVACTKKFAKGRAKTEFKNALFENNIHCKCLKDKCVSKKCSKSCKLICKHKYSLGRWSCKTDTVPSSVPIKMLCDGVNDCKDHSDEDGCIEVAVKSKHEKFQANTLYDEVIELIGIKIQELSDTNPIRNLIFRLHSDVSEMVKLNIKSQNDTAEFKIVRDHVFKSLPKLYGAMVKERLKSEINETKIYTFFKTINHKLASALKYSHTGNDQRVTIDRCYCIGTMCGLSNCSKTCKIVCMSNTILSRYICYKDSKVNATVAMENICDGVIDCPKNEDEEYCDTGSCQSFDLIHFKEDIVKMVNKEKGTNLTEHLYKWLFKLFKYFKKAEKSKRIKENMKQIMQASIEDLIALKKNQQIHDDRKLVEISQRMISSIKWCGN